MEKRKPVSYWHSRQAWLPEFSSVSYVLQSIDTTATSWFCQNILYKINKKRLRTLDFYWVTNTKDGWDLEAWWCWPPHKSPQSTCWRSRGGKGHPALGLCPLWGCSPSPTDPVTLMTRQRGSSACWFNWLSVLIVGLMEVSYLQKMKLSFFPGKSTRNISCVGKRLKVTVKLLKFIFAGFDLAGAWLWILRCLFKCHCSCSVCFPKWWDQSGILNLAEGRKEDYMELYGIILVLNTAEKPLPLTNTIAFLCSSHISVKRWSTGLTWASLCKRPTASCRDIRDSSARETASADGIFTNVEAKSWQKPVNRFFCVYEAYFKKYVNKILWTVLKSLSKIDSSQAEKRNNFKIDLSTNHGMFGNAFNEAISEAQQKTILGVRIINHAHNLLMLLNHSACCPLELSLEQKHWNELIL